MNVDEAGRDEQAPRIIFLPPGAGDLTNRRDNAVLDRHVCFAQRAPGAVSDRPAANDQIMRLGHFSLR